ncbi:hypothetical protein ACET3X_002861 [Alternaria dauci]|uniref:Uncharacterized protein n=1 Tax=Alternaria dauci TaxID=48095 RepID=A0ABR3USN0_9PLEO
MASKPIAVGSRKFNWADDDDDDFDLASWNATADTSAPSAAELGPLQVPPAGDATKEDDETYTLSRIRNEHACGVSPVPEEPPTTELAQVPELTAQLPAEYWYLAVLNCRPEHQVMSARFDRITRAIGLRYDGKEDPDAPAYPELSSNKAYRSNYTKGFQSWKMKHRSLPCSNVYRCSPLNIVTSIENAHEIDDIDVGADEEVEEVLDEYEAMQIFAFEQHEQDQVFVSDHYERDEEADREMNEEIDRMLFELSRNNVDIAEQFSRKELEDLYHEYKAQQLENDEVDTEQQYAKAGLDVIEEEDTASMDSFEASCGDEELFGSSDPYTTSNEKLFLTTNMTQDKKILSSLSIPFDATATEEDLDFNNIVFEDEDKTQDYKSDIRSETDSEPADEGYASSSPPITPTLECFTAIGKRHTQNCFVTAEMRLSSSSMRRKTNGRTHSMDALQEFRQAARNEQPVDDAFDEDEEYAVLESVQQEETSYNQLEVLPGADKSPEFTLIVEPPEEDTKTSDCPLSDLAPTLIEESNSASSDEADYQHQPSVDEERGILNMSFAFPGPSADHTPSKTSSRRWTDPPKYIPDPPPVLPSPAHRHKKQNSLSLVHLASVVTKSKFYISEMPWTQVGVMAAGVVAGGLLSMARRH